MNTSGKYRMVSVLSLMLLSSMLVYGAEPVSYASRLTEATRSYSQGHLDEALPQWQQLLVDFPQAPNTDLSLLRVAQCAIAGKHWEQAAAMLTTLRGQFPASAYRAEAAVLLYTADLQLNKSTEADLLWSEILTQWPDAIYPQQATTLFLLAPHATAPEQASDKLRQILAQDWTPLEFTRIVYTPLIQAGRIATVIAMHNRCQELLKAANIPAEQMEREDAAYHDCFTKAAVEAMFQQLKNALDDHDLKNAEHWLTVMNTVAAANRRAAEGRDLFRAATEGMNQK